MKSVSPPPDLECDISRVGVSKYSVAGMPGDFTVEIHDSFDDYTEMMKSIFDFDAIREQLKTTKVVLNSMHGVTGTCSACSSIKQNTPFEII